MHQNARLQIVALVLWALAAPAVGAAELCEEGRVVRHRQYGDALSEWRVVAGSGFTETGAVECASRLIAARHRSLLDVLHFSDAALSMFLIQPTSGGLPLWEVHRGLARRRAWNIVSVTSTARGSVIRFRFGEKSGRRVLSGEDPLVLTLDGIRYDIAWIAFSGSGLHPLQVFVTAEGPLSLQSGRRLLQHLAAMLPEKPLRVVLRNDYWFTEEPEFPVFYPFGGDEPVALPKDSMTRGPQIVCTLVRGQHGCHWGRHKIAGAE